MGVAVFDRALELFQLGNATGKRFSLLPKYKERVALSQYFEIKKDYYHFWDDIKHLALAGLDQERALLKLGENCCGRWKRSRPERIDCHETFAENARSFHRGDFRAFKPCRSAQI